MVQFRKMDLDNFVRPNIKDLVAYSSARSLTTGDYTYLDANEMSAGGYEFSRYPAPQPSAIIEWISKKFQFDKNRIILGRGLDEVLECLFKAFVDPSKDYVVTTPPTYGFYEVLANIHGCSVCYAPLTAENFELDVEKISQFDEAKLVFLCSPNNPTGNSLPLADIEKLAESMSDSLIVIDEAYIDFSDDASALRLLDRYENVLILRTFSKSSGMAGTRLGFALGSERIINFLKKVIAPYPISQPVVEAFVRCQSQGYLEQVEKVVDEVKKTRESFLQTLETYNFVNRIYPTQANFVLVKVDNAEKLCEFLRERGVIIRNRSKELNLGNCVRISIDTKQDMEKLKIMLANFDTVKGEV